MYKLISLFSGAGGLDLGFEQIGFEVIWANENDKTIWDTYQLNHPTTQLDKRDIQVIPNNEIPDCDGIIGGPPCQSWSEAGKQKGTQNSRGKLFFEFIKIINIKNPKFFLAENVTGLLQAKHKEALENIKQMLTTAGNMGYNLSIALLNASNYLVPQDRQRLFLVGIRKDLNVTYRFPEPNKIKITLDQAIKDLQKTAIPISCAGTKNSDLSEIPNNEYITGSYSKVFMARNRVRSWEQQSFTIQAQGRHIPLHPQAPKMNWINHNQYSFEKGKEYLYRHLTVRECARIQTFPDNFFFEYQHISDGYKMVGNAVPVRLARAMAKEVKDLLDNTEKFILVAYCKSEKHCEWVKKYGIYNIRLTTFLQAGINENQARYLLLYTKNTKHKATLFKLHNQNQIISARELTNKNYPTHPQAKSYILFHINKEDSTKMGNQTYDISMLQTIVTNKAIPSLISFSDCQKN